jgi:hypothetical protein
MVKKHRILGLTFDERLNWKEGDKKMQSTKKLVPHIVGFGPE